MFSGMDAEIRRGSSVVVGVTPNNTRDNYDNNLAQRVNSGKSVKSWRLSTAETLAPQPALYNIPDRAESVNNVGAGIWTVKILISLFEDAIHWQGQL